MRSAAASWAGPSTGERPPRWSTQRWPWPSSIAARETLIHIDHGPQYTSWTFSQKVRYSGLAQSIGTVGDAFDNAVVESFWGTMQIELLNRQSWTTRLKLSTAIVDRIEGFYNRRRRHSSLGNISPAEYERRHQPIAA